MSKSTLLIEMIDLLRERPGIGLAELARAVRRSERTVYRWLSEISNCLHVSITCANGGYYLADRTCQAAVALNPQELMALRLSLNSGPFADGSPVKGYAESAWRKISEACVWEDAQAAESLARGRAVGVTAFPAGLPGELAETLNRAVDSHRRLRVVYRSQKSRKVGEYTIDPYALAFRRHSWYLVGYCREYQKMIQMKLVRFVSAVETGETFNPPADFSVEEFFASSWEAWAGDELVRVRVRFDPEVAEMISEVKRHPTQVTYPQPDGGIIFEVTVAGIEEIAAWIMGYGRHAVVLEPRRLRDYVFDHALAMAANHTPERAARAPYESSIEQVVRELDLGEREPDNLSASSQTRPSAPAEPSSQPAPLSQARSSS